MKDYVKFDEQLEREMKRQDRNAVLIVCAFNLIFWLIYVWLF